MRKISGFTLIELLVVIAVIALLLAILMPALNKQAVSQLVLQREVILLSITARNKIFLE